MSNTDEQVTVKVQATERVSYSQTVTMSRYEFETLKRDLDSATPNTGSAILDAINRRDVISSDDIEINTFRIEP